MNTRKYRVFVCDTETVVYEGQTETSAWANAFVELFADDSSCEIHHSLAETWTRLFQINGNILIYYHNLKFDGSFWLDFLIRQLGMEQAIRKDLETGQEYFLEPPKMPPNSVSYSISDRGQWYRIIVKVDGRTIEFRDSLKLLPFSVAQIAKAFCKNRRKLDMEYKGKRYPGCAITDKEKEYITSDALIPKEALELMYEEGHNKLTIGSCCLSEFKKTFLMGIDEYKATMPDLTKEDAAPWTLYKNADSYIRESYRGGWCYLKKGCANKVFYDGVTADVNSEYPFVMHSMSGNKYPYGKPAWFKGDIPDKAKGENFFYFVRIKTRFKLKKGKLPFVTFPGNFLYPPHEQLETSDYYDYKAGKYYDHLVREDGSVYQMRPEMVLSEIDYKLLKEHYVLYDTEVLDGCYFYARTGLFDEYIDHYKSIKETSTGAKRNLAKLYLNNLYGKLAANCCSSFKVVYFDENEVMKFRTIERWDKQAGYIPIGAAVTAYARYWVITHAQDNYENFIYADTDSIHCCCAKEDLVNIETHKTKLGAWDIEKEWDRAIFVRQKTYIEIERGEWEVKCAGMPDRCKWLFRYSCREDGVELKEIDGDDWIVKDDDKKVKIEDNMRWFLEDERQLEDFKVGLIVPGKLMTKRIKGGTILVDSDYEISKKWRGY